MSNRFLRYSIIALTLAVGCTREDLSECKVDLRIQHRYTLNTENKDLFAQKVHQLALYVFDANERFYDVTFIDDAKTLGADNAFDVALPAGNYTLVTWAGEPQTYHLGEAPTGAELLTEGLRRGVTQLSDFRLRVSQEAVDTAIVTQPAHLFHGIERNIQVADVPEVQTVAIDLVKNTHLLHVSIVGLEALTRATSNPITVYVTGNNGSYCHDNTFDVTTRRVKYLPHSEVVTGDQMVSWVQLLRLMPSHPLLLTVADTRNGAIYSQFDLLPYLMQLPDYGTQEGLDREEQFNVELKIDANYKVYIKINEWQLIHVIPIMP
ncbi:MAG: FimB/Mfa2 family fimbrial subunit [Alistipes sp.]